MVIYYFIYYGNETHFVCGLDVIGIKTHVFVSNKRTVIVFLSLRLSIWKFKICMNYTYHIAKFAYNCIYVLWQSHCECKILPNKEL